MKISRTTVEKLMITEVPGLDPIAVIAEDFGPGQGKITITCFGEAWSCYWGGMGEANKLTDFFRHCDEQYLAGKLSTTPEWIKDETALTEGLKKAVVEQRRERDIGKARARELWEMAEGVDAYDEAEVCYQILGDEWWLSVPQRKNPDYLYLCKIVNAVKSALALAAEVPA